MAIYYAGIGSRRTPRSICVTMTRIAAKLEMLGYKLRSGGAPGADEAFEDGVTSLSNMDIYLPCPNWRGNLSPHTAVSQEAMDLSEKFHPNYGALSTFGKWLMGRNSYQILGEDLKTPVLFVICYTPDGCDMVRVQRTSRTGGTGQALSIAHTNNIPIFNLYHDDTLKNFEAFIRGQTKPTS